MNETARMLVYWFDYCDRYLNLPDENRGAVAALWAAYRVAGLDSSTAFTRVYAEHRALFAGHEPWLRGGV